LFAFGHEKMISLRALTDGLVSVTIAILLVRHWGMPGVAFGFLCGIVFISIPWDVILLMKTLEISLAELGRPYLPMLWRIAAAGCFALAVHAWFPAPTVLRLGIAASGVGAVYLLLMIPYVWTTPLRGYIQDATSTVTSAMRTRVLGWSNNL